MMNTKFVFSAFILSIFLFFGCSTPLINDAALNGELNSIMSIVSKKRYKLYEKDYDGRTPLHNAALGGHFDVVKYLVSQGSDVNAKDNDGDTPLHLAVIRNKLKIVEYLVSQSAKLDSKDNHGNTPLHWASNFGYTKIVKFLVSQGADVNALDNYGNSPIQLAAKRGRLDIIKYLVSHGADVNAVDNFGYTPLHDIVSSHWSKSKEKLEIVKFLVSKGADINKKDQHGKTALDLTREKEYITIEAFLSSQIQIAKQNETQFISSKKVTEKEQNKDKSPPKIIITSHDTSRGMKVVESKKEVRITGRTVDESGIVEVVVNGKEATLDNFGNFEAHAYLTIGENKIIVSAMDLYENRSYKTFTIIREAKEASTDTKVYKSLAGARKQQLSAHKEFGDCKKGCRSCKPNFRNSIWIPNDFVARRHKK